MSAAVLTLPAPAGALRERAVLAVALLYAVTSMFTGPLRWILGQAHLAPLIYLPNLLVLGVTAWQFAAEAGERFTPLRLIALAAVGHALIVGLLFLPPVQVAFGFYTLLPLWFGLSCGPVLLRNEPALARLAPWLWLCAAGGVFLNALGDLPWEGFEYSVGNVDIEASRDWVETGGGKRLAGLARSSFDAAIQIQILALIAVLHTRRFAARAVLWALTAAAIWLTTSKGVLNVYAVLTPIVLLRGLLPEAPLRALPLGFGLLGLALPMSTLFFRIQWNIRDEGLANLLFSFYDRLNNMWPEAWRLLAERGSVLFGRGLGGIGTAQSYFEPDLFNAGDNVYMYWLVVYGALAFPGFLLLLARSLRLKPWRGPEERLLYCLTLATVVYGMTTNVVENAFFALVCGSCVRLLATPASESPGDGAA